MPKRKTTILIDEKVWRNLLSYTVKKYGTAKKTSIEIENAIKAYLEKSLKS